MLTRMFAQSLHKVRHCNAARHAYPEVVDLDVHPRCVAWLGEPNSDPTPALNGLPCDELCVPYPRASSSSRRANIQRQNHATAKGHTNHLHPGRTPWLGLYYLPRCTLTLENRRIQTNY